MKKSARYILISSIVFVSIVLDIVTKIIFGNVFANRTEAIVVIPDFFDFTYLKNTGAAYGMLGGHTWLLILVSIAFMVGFVIYDILNKSNNKWYLWGVSLILGGAIGNFIDRIFLGYVRDFISIKLFSFVFNLADLFITIGVICFVIYIIVDCVNDIKNKKEKRDGNTEDK